MSVRPGPKPKPALIRQMEGNRGRVPMVPDDVGLSTGMPVRKPAVVRNNAEANAEWNRIIKSMPPELYEAGDAVILTEYCLAWALYLQAQEGIDKYGILIFQPIYDGKGCQVGEKMIENPAIKTWKTAAEKLNQTADRLGLTPTARARMQIPGKVSEDPKRQRSFQHFIKLPK